MATFTDKAGRAWRVEIDVFLLERVAARTEVRLDQMLAEKAAVLTDLFADLVRFARVLWVLVEEQAAPLGVTAEQFGRALAGDHLEAAARAFLEALADFSPSHQRKLLRALVAKGDEVTEKVLAAALKKIAATTPDSSDSATSSPASSASTPAPEG